MIFFRILANVLSPAKKERTKKRGEQQVDKKTPGLGASAHPLAKKKWQRLRPPPTPHEFSRIPKNVLSPVKKQNCNVG
jgi:hypothetical protein